MIKRFFIILYKTNFTTSNVLETHLMQKLNNMNSPTFVDVFKTNMYYRRLVDGFGKICSCCYQEFKLLRCHSFSVIMLCGTVLNFEQC
ncbi:hypothetical protein HanIR_Chr03g0118311 [Helianthus annuus]|nr:hypothetical protein HanIR_Chr03g0118311 [Helianthus annuus]